jgi:hypothetical protein
MLGRRSRDVQSRHRLIQTASLALLKDQAATRPTGPRHCIRIPSAAGPVVAPRRQQLHSAAARRPREPYANRGFSCNRRQPRFVDRRPLRPAGWTKQLRPARAIRVNIPCAAPCVGSLRCSTDADAGSASQSCDNDQRGMAGCLPDGLLVQVLRLLGVVAGRTQLTVLWWPGRQVDVCDVDGRVRQRGFGLEMPASEPSSSSDSASCFPSHASEGMDGGPCGRHVVYQEHTGSQRSRSADQPFDTPWAARAHARPDPEVTVGRGQQLGLAVLHKAG